MPSPAVHPSERGLIIDGVVLGVTRQIEIFRAASGAAARVGVAESAGIAPTAARIATAAVKPLARIVKLSLGDGWFPIVALAGRISRVIAPRVAPPACTISTLAEIL